MVSIQLKHFHLKYSQFKLKKFDWFESWIKYSLKNNLNILFRVCFWIRISNLLPEYFGFREESFCNSTETINVLATVNNFINTFRHFRWISILLWLSHQFLHTKPIIQIIFSLTVILPLYRWANVEHCVKEIYCIGKFQCDILLEENQTVCIVLNEFEFPF